MRTEYHTREEDLIRTNYLHVTARKMKTKRYSNIQVEISHTHTHAENIGLNFCMYMKRINIYDYGIVFCVCIGGRT